MTNLWVTFSTDISGNFTELSGNIIYNLNNIYNFNGNVIDTISNFIIYELTNNPIQGDVLLQANNWKQLSLNNNLSPFQGYWLGGINTNLPQIFTNRSELATAIENWTNNPIPVVNIYGLIENWNVGNVTSMEDMFEGATSFNKDLNNWNVGNVTSMNSMFGGATSFNGNISNWDVGNVTNMSFMFGAATSFNGNISNWDVGNVTSMENMFFMATSFNQDLNNWNVGNVTSMNAMFGGATSFNKDLNNWNVGNVTSMNSIFGGATSFNGNISNWNVGNVTNMNAMFAQATSFNGNISNWNVGNVRNMDYMFAEATSFNGNISNWNVGNVTNMNSMFAGATSFNQDLNNWNVGNVTNMNSMFAGATSFNGNISNWNVGNVTNMNSMFSGANTFNQDISNWDIGNVTDGNLNEMFKDVTFFTDMNTKIFSNGTPFNYFIYQQNTISQTALQEIILSTQDLNNSNLGTRWILKNLQNVHSGDSGGSITTTSDIQANINEMYNGILEIDTSNEPDVIHSDTNYVYENTGIFLSRSSFNSNYVIIWLTWEDTTRLIENLSLTFA